LRSCEARAWHALGALKTRRSLRRKGVHTQQVQLIGFAILSFIELVVYIQSVMGSASPTSSLPVRLSKHSAGALRGDTLQCASHKQ
jgi:hypothetical protein